jgi:hypothetical protein
MAALVLLAGCSGSTPAVQNAIRCDSQTAAGGMCAERIDPISDTARLSILAQCREVNGTIVDECPARNLIGVCEIAEDTSRAWTLNRTTRVHHYLHPDAATPEAIARIAEGCNSPRARWTPAPPAAQ